MGLDMYMFKVSKVKDMTADEVLATAGYIDYLNRPEEYADSSFADWCGGNMDLVRKDKLDEVKKLIHKNYCAWDTDKKYGHDEVTTDVAYWRKANAIHNWFVENVQNGNDDCGRYPVSEDQIKDLFDVVMRVRKSCKLIDGEVVNGYTFKDGKEIPNIEKGKIVEDPTLAKELLPTTSGFFFGGTNYDQWYVDDLDETLRQLTDIIATTDFDKEIVFYQSSW